MQIDNSGAVIGQQNISSSIINNISGTKPFTQQNINSEVINNYLSRSAEYGELMEQLAEFQEMYDDTPESKAEKREKYAIKMAKQQEKIEQYRQDVFRLAERFSQISINTDRIKRAKAYFEEGKFREADAVLDENEIEQEQQALLKNAKKKKQELNKLQGQLKENAAEFILKAQTTLLRLEEAEQRITKACHYYEQALNSDRSGDNLFDYANFLLSYRLFDQALEYYEEALKVFQKLSIDDTNYGLAVAIIYHNMAHLYALHHQKETAEDFYKKSLETQKPLMMTYPDVEVILSQSVDTLNKMANLFIEHYEFDKAIGALEYALESSRDLVESNPEYYQTDLAVSLNNLGKLHYACGHFDQAEQTFRESAELFKVLYEQEMDQAYIPNLAKIHCNIGTILQEKAEYEEAEKFLKTGNTMFRSLMAKDADLYMADYANSLNSMGIVHNRLGQIDLALQEFEEALDGFKQLTPYNPEVYLPEVANVLGNTAEVYLKLNRPEEAHQCHQNALNYFIVLAKDKPSLFLPDVARVLLNLSIFKMKVQDMEEGLMNSLKALDTLMPFLELDPVPQAVLAYARRALEICQVLQFDTEAWLMAEFPDKIWIMKLLE